MKDKEKIAIAILVVITIIVIIVAIVRENSKKNEENNNQRQEIEVVQEKFTQTLGDGTKLNTSSKLQETKTMEGMEISNIQLTEKDNQTLLLGTVTNVSDTTQGGYPVNIKILDEAGNEITTVSGIIGTLEPGKSTQFSSSATFDYANAYDFEITKK